MSSHRMYLRPTLSKLLIWTSIAIVQARNVTLSSDVTHFIPSCAQDCVASFVTSNYQSCSDTASLQCLCSSRSASNYTIGEGAVECIVAEHSIGQCSDTDGSTSVVVNAYEMCNGQSNALPNTHATLSATLLVPTSGAGVIVIATPTSTATGSVSGATTTSALSFHTITGTSTGVSTTRATSSSSTTVVAASGASQPVPTSSSSTSVLSTGQLVGLIVGIAAAFGIAIILICLARRNRKHVYTDVDEGAYTGHNEKDNSGSSKKRFTQIMNISSPLHRISRPWTPQPVPNPYGVGQEAIGLAITAPQSQAVDTPSSMPQRTKAPQYSTETSPNFPVYNQPPKPVAQNGRSQLSPGSNPNFPSPRGGPSAQSKPPQSDAQAGYNRQIDTSRDREQPPQANRPNLTLSIPSQARLHPSSATRSAHRSQTDRASTLTNVTGFADLDAEARESGQIWRPPPSDPQSATTYYVADRYGNWVLNNDTRQSELAQTQVVAELDTYTPLTKSPHEVAEEAAMAAAMAGAVSTASAAPQKPQPAFLSVDPNMNSGYSVSRSSSVYSQASAIRPNVRPVQPGPRKDSLRKKENAPRVKRSDSNLSQHSATSFETVSSNPGDEDNDFEPDPSHLSNLSPVVELPSPGRSPVSYPRIPGRLANSTIRTVPPPKRPNFNSSPPGQPSPTLGAVIPVKSSPGMYPRPLNPRRPSAGMGLPQGPGAGSGFSPAPGPVPRFTGSPRQRPRVDTQVQYQQPHIASFASPSSAMTTSSNASSLLAKRLGAERANALALEGAPPNKRPPQWRRDGDNGFLSPERIGGRPVNDQGLPATPTWLPKLTPTRRGEELFLSVQ